MNKVKFSVLLSIYYKEKPEYFRECMESVYSQTVLPDEIVLVEDGRLTDELYEAISEYECRPSEINFVTVKLEKNSGLGLALAEGIKHCSNELVARMDTDDICVPDRFERQLNAFSENPKLDIIGGYISEFSDDTHNILSERTVPLGNYVIKQYQRKRDAFNHMTMANIGETLVYARTGDDMLRRRGGFDYFLKYKAGRKRILKTGTISAADYFVTISAQLVVCMMPLWMRSLVFKKILRN